MKKKGTPETTDQIVGKLRVSIRRSSEEYKDKLRKKGYIDSKDRLSTGLTLRSNSKDLKDILKKVEREEDLSR
jgi:hypothetical protein